MKSSTTTTTCFLVLLLVSSCMVNAQTVCDKDSGFLKFLESLQAGTVAVTAKPQSGGWTVCAKVFADSANTCCDPVKLKLAFKTAAESVKAEWGKFIEGVARYKNSAMAIKIVAGGDAVQTKAQEVATNLDSITADQAKAIVGKLDSINDDITTFKTKAAACFAAANIARTNIFCAACAKSDQLAGTTDVTFKFKSGSCAALFDSCHPVWSFMFNLQAAVKVAYEVKRGKTRTAAEAPKGVPAVPSGSKLGDIQSRFSKCASGKAGQGTCTTAEVDAICKDFLNFKKAEPFATAPNNDDLTQAADAPGMSSPGSTGSGSVSSGPAGSGTTSSSGSTGSGTSTSGSTSSTNPTSIPPSPPKRILTGGATDGTGSPGEGSAGVDLALEDKVLETVTVDATTAGDNPNGTPFPISAEVTNSQKNNTSSSGNILMTGFVGLIAVLLQQ